VTNASGVAFDATHLAGAQDLVNVLVANLDPVAAANSSRVQVSLGGVMIPVTITSVGGGRYQLQFIVPQSFGGIAVPLAVVVDGSASTPLTITVR
jgi:uncharacterized protein (TIGR03437 family)